jgi:DNA invertase Pin-like site-specific DNA recombinase
MPLASRRRGRATAGTLLNQQRGLRSCVNPGPGLEACIKALRQCDTLVAWKLDRLGRDLRHLINLVHDLTRRGSA